MRAICCLLVLTSFSFLAKGQLKFLRQTPDIIRDSATVVEDWKQLENVLKRVANDGVKTVLPLLMNNAQNSNVSSTCIKEAMQIIGGIRKLKSWAIKFLDSTAKSVDGVLSGTTFSYGAYDECIDTVVIDQHSGKHKGKVMFTGKYCMLHIKPHLPPKKTHYEKGEIMEELKDFYKSDTVLSNMAEMAALMYYFSIRLAVCVPSGCSVEDIDQLLATVSDYTRLHMKVNSCEVKEDPIYTPIMIIVMSLYSFAGFMVLLGTLTDVYCYYSEKKPCRTSIRILLAFSLMSNFRKLVNTSSQSKQLRCLNGIRFFSITWVIMAHSYHVLMFQAMSNLEYFNDTGKNFAFQVVLNPFASVDTFFFLGGFMVCYVATKHVKIANRNFNIKFHILHRLWRILPSYIFVVLYISIAELVSSGPSAYTVIRLYVQACADNWWTNILFLNNFYHALDNKCLLHTWYLSADMQLYIGSLIILLPLLRWPKVGKILAVVTIVSSMAATAVLVSVKNLSATLKTPTYNIEESVYAVEEYHIKPYPHIGPYVIGILTGNFLAMNPDVKIPKMTQLFGWICAIIMATSTVYGSYTWNSGRDATFLENVFYGSCNKVAWALSLAWMIICCATGHGGVVNYILSWKAWIPLGRLTFMVYLVHLLVQISFVATLRNPIDPMQPIMIWVFFGHLFVSFAVAFAGSMLIEAPASALEKLFLSQRKENITEISEKEANNPLDMTVVVKEEMNN